MDQGEELRRVVPARPVDRDVGGPDRCLRGDTIERRRRPALEHRGHGLRGGRADRVHHHLHDAPARGRAAYRDPGGRGPAALGRHRGGGGRRRWDAPQRGDGAVTVRCRFAPAPSGSLHVGNVRSALFSWLWARRNGGAFILRVEDTDRSRVTEEAVRGAIEDLRWLGLEWDEGPEVGGPHGPYRQSERLDIYRTTVERLRMSGDAYVCYCTKEELAARDEQQRARGEPTGYDGHCRDLSDAERAAFEAEGRLPAIRFRMPQR